MATRTTPARTAGLLLVRSMRSTRKLLPSVHPKKAASIRSHSASVARPLQPFLLERFEGWNDATMSLSSSECEPLSLAELLTYADDVGLHRWETLSLGYVEPSQGSEDVRQAIVDAQFTTSTSTNDSNHEQQPQPPPQQQQQLIHPGCVNVCAPQEGIWLALHALVLQPGDHVVVVAPAYQSLHELAASLGCEVDLWWPEDDGVDISVAHGTGTQTVPTLTFRPETLQTLLRPGQTKLVVANFPHNPTGALPTREDFHTMMDMVQHCGAWFLVDEMYRGLEHPQPTTSSSSHQPSQPQPSNDAATAAATTTPATAANTNESFVAPLPPVATCMPKGISLGGLSKSYGLPGLRIGWLVSGNPAFQRRVQELKDYTTICPPAPSEALALIALRAHDALWHRNRTIVAEGLGLVRQFVLEHSDRHPADDRFEWCEPQGGTFAWVRLQSHTSMSASDYCQAVRQRTGLMMVPSGLFPECQATDDRIRLTYGRRGLANLLKVWQRDLEQGSG